MPLTELQAKVARLLSENRSEDSYLAGGAAILIDPRSMRFSNDLDYFHDSVERVATAHAADCRVLEERGYHVRIDMHQPGYIRAVVREDDAATKVEWAHDSAWRFLPTVRSEVCGYQLHPIDLAASKVLTLAGRDEPRDLLDTLYVHREVLSLGALCWAAPGKDPGFTPLSLLELLRRRGRVRPEDLQRLHLAAALDLTTLKSEWLAALGAAEVFVRSRPFEEAGCLYYSRECKRFVEPDEADDAVPHYGRPGGVLPRIVREDS